MKSPITDKSLGIVLNSDIKFADVRSKAHEEYIERKRNHKKDKTIKLPKYKIGDLVVISESYFGKDRCYVLVEIIDYNKSYRRDFTYYGIVQKVSNQKDINIIGRIIHFSNFWIGYKNVDTDLNMIKWVDEK